MQKIKVIYALKHITVFEQLIRLKSIDISIISVNLIINPLQSLDGPPVQCRLTVPNKPGPVGEYKFQPLHPDKLVIHVIY